jgi:LmbE family N-acetylglucosaminyl deacetylase
MAINKNMDRVLVVAAHPDDEVLGCGGTIARLAADGAEVHILIVAEGCTSRGDEESAQGVLALKQAAVAAAKTLGVNPPIFLSLPDNRLDSVDFLDVTQMIEAVISEVKPDTIYTHHGGDLNIDHQIVFQGVLTASRPVPESVVKRLYTFETVSSSEWSAVEIGPCFNPNRYVNITKYLLTKQQALGHYSMEMRLFPHARSSEAIDALARLRGSQCGFEAAEAFRVILDISDT